MIQPEQIIEKVCHPITVDEKDTAAAILLSKYPHRPIDAAERRYTEYQSTLIFFRDGFVDRYSGQKLVFPAVLRTLSLLIPDQFPFHRNWKTTDCHRAYWQLCPTIDHIVPVSRGGADSEANWVCTSMLHNSAKANWLLEELGWQLYPPGDIKVWDGLVGWFLAYCRQNEDILSDRYIKRWHSAATRASKRDDTF